MLPGNLLSCVFTTMLNTMHLPAYDAQPSHRFDRAAHRYNMEGPNMALKIEGFATLNVNLSDVGEMGMSGVPDEVEEACLCTGMLCT